MNTATENVEQGAQDAEKVKVKSAITTDFILSIEIVIIALGSVLEESLQIRIVTVSAVSILATVGVYGIVALIVRMDDAGYKLMQSSGNKGFISIIGSLLVKALPVIIRVLGVVGTIALILVSGGIFVHNIEYFHHLFPAIPSVIKELILGLVAGLLVAVSVTGGKKVFFVVQKLKNEVDYNFKSYRLFEEEISEVKNYRDKRSICFVILQN